MLYNNNPIGICLVFPQLQITGSVSLVFYIVFLILLSTLFEYLRLTLSLTDRSLRSQLRSPPLPAASSAVGSRTPALGGGGGSSQGMRRDGSERGEEALLNGGGVGGRRSVRLPLGIQLRRSVGFTVNAAIAFYLMLIVMTYNGPLILAVLMGTFLGHFLCTREFDLYPAGGGEDKGLSCH